MNIHYNQSWYGEKAEVIKKNQNYFVINYGCKGKGIVSNYNLFDGISCCFLDFDTEEVMPSQKFNPDIISIVHCHTGRYECEFSNHQIFYLSEGYFSIMGTKYLPISYSFPLKKCYAFSLVIDKHEVSQNTKNILKMFNIDIDNLSEKLALDEKGYLSQPSSDLKHLFSEIYSAKDKEKIEYFRIKALEFLYHIASLSRHNKSDFKYYDKKYIQFAKEIHNSMIEHLDEKISLKQLTAEKYFNLSLFHKVFTQIYGDTPYAYMKKYKMNIAANELKNTDRKINEIAMSLGYSNASKFSIAFHSVYGILPKDYRKQNN